MTGYKKLPNAKPIVNITIDEELLKKIEDFRFKNRIANRSQTISFLVEEGFKAIEEKVEPNYVTFEEAVQALNEGKKIRRVNDSAWYTDSSILEYSLIEWVKEFAYCDFWIVEETK